MDCETNTDQTKILTESCDDDTKLHENDVDVKHEQIVAQCEEMKSIRRSFVVVTCFNIILLWACVFLAVNHTLDEGVKVTNNTSMTVKSENRNGSDFQKSLISNESMEIVKGHIFCIKCDDFDGPEQIFYRILNKDRCCLKNISSLIHYLKSTIIKSSNELYSEIDLVNSSINAVRENINTLTDEIFSSNKSNYTGKDVGTSVKESVMWSALKKNNHLLNLLLNERRSVLHLSGIALNDGMYWSVEVATGGVSYDNGKIYINNGGQYLITCNIYFSKNLCDGAENISYNINQEYRPGEMLRLARARAHCATGSSIDENLQLKTVQQVGLGQKLILKLEYDENLQSLIPKWNRNHQIIIYEI